MPSRTAIEQVGQAIIARSSRLADWFRPLDPAAVATIRHSLPVSGRDRWVISSTRHLTFAPFHQPSHRLHHHIHSLNLPHLNLLLLNYALYFDAVQLNLNHHKNFGLLLNLYVHAATFFRNPDAAFFTPAIKSLSHALVHLAIFADRQNPSIHNDHASQAARQLTTTLGLACIDRSPDEPNKRRAAFSLANDLFKIYFFLNNLRLCDSVVKNTSNVIHQLESHHPKSEWVTFYYYMGRLALYQRRCHQARHFLKRAFDFCRSDSSKNRRLILIYLIASSLPLGILPHPALLLHFSLSDQFGQVVQSLRKGNWPGVKAGLDHQREWFRLKGIYLLLQEKLQVICWRNFFVILAGIRNGSQGIRLSIPNSVVPAQKVFMDPSIDLDDITCMASSLIDQGYLRAYVKLGEVIVFGSVLPKISTVGEHLNDHVTIPSVTTIPPSTHTPVADRTRPAPNDDNDGHLQTRPKSHHHQQHHHHRQHQHHQVGKIYRGGSGKSKLSHRLI